MLSCRDVRVHFGGVTALDGVSFEVERRADRRHHRPERRRQDDALQLHQPPLPGARRRHSLRGSVASLAAAPSDRGARHRAHVPERRPVRHVDGGRQRDARRARALASRIHRRRAASAVRGSRRARAGERGGGAPRTRSNSRASPTGARATCRSARASASSSRARSRASRACSCSTSRSPGSITTRSTT